MDESLVVNQVKRQRRSLAEKRSIVEQTLQAGTRVADIARQHGINDNLIFNWRKLYLNGRLGEAGKSNGPLLPVKVCDDPRPAFSIGNASGTISIKTRKAQIRIEGRADANLVAMVLEHLLR